MHCLPGVPRPGTTVGEDIYRKHLACDGSRGHRRGVRVSALASSSTRPRTACTRSRPSWSPRWATEGAAQPSSAVTTPGEPADEHSGQGDAGPRPGPRRAGLPPREVAAPAAAGARNTCPARRSTRGRGRGGGLANSGRCRSGSGQGSDLRGSLAGQHVVHGRRTRPAIFLRHPVSIRWPTPPTMPPTTASASYSSATCRHRRLGSVTRHVGVHGARGRRPPGPHGRTSSAPAGREADLPVVGALDGRHPGGDRHQGSGPSPRAASGSQPGIVPTSTAGSFSASHTCCRRRAGRRIR